jgi:hypothetical protein
VAGRGRPLAGRLERPVGVVGHLLGVRVGVRVGELGDRGGLVGARAGRLGDRRHRRHVHVVPSVPSQRVGQRVHLARPVAAHVDRRVEAPAPESTAEDVGDDSAERPRVVTVGVQVLEVRERLHATSVQQPNPVTAKQGRSDEVPSHETGATDHQKVHEHPVKTTAGPTGD